MAQDFDIRAALGVAETEPPAPPPPPLSMDFKAIDREGPLKPQYGSQAKLPEPFDIRKAAMQPPRLEGGERVKQDIRSAVLGLGEGIAGTVATGARALMGTAGVPVPLTKGEGAVKAEATQRVHEGAMAPFEAVAPAAPTKPYTPRQFEEGVFSAGGSSITFLGPGAVARAAGLGMKGLQLLAGTLGASQSFGQRYVEAWKESGDEDKAFAAGLISAAGGATEAFGGEALALGRLMGSANRATKGALAVILESSAENAGQEAVQQVVDNIARRVYDGDAKLLDGVVQAAAIGGTIGSLFGAVAASVERMRSGGSAQSQPTQSPEKAPSQPASIAQLVTPLETAPLDPESVGHMDAIRADPKMAALPQAEKLVQVKPTLPEQVWAQEWLNQRGMKAVFVQDTDGKALPFRGTNYRDTVYMDAALPPTEIKRRVVYHEAVHSLPGPVVNDLLAVWRKVDPKGYASLEASVAAKYPTEQVGEEAAAHNAERLVDLIAEGEVDPARLQKIINANPTLWQKFVRAIRAAAEKLGLTTPDQQFPDAVQAVEYLRAFDELLKRPTVKQQWNPAQPEAAAPVATSPAVQEAVQPTVEQRTAEIAPNLPPSRAPQGEKMVSAMTKQERSFAPKGIGDIVEHEGRLAEVTDVSGPRGRKSRLRIRYMERLPENEFGIREDPVRYINRGDALLVSRAGVLTREEQIHAEARRRAEQEAQATPRFAIGSVNPNPEDKARSDLFASFIPAPGSSVALADVVLRSAVNAGVYNDSYITGAVAKKLSEFAAPKGGAPLVILSTPVSTRPGRRPLGEFDPNSNTIQISERAVQRGIAHTVFIHELMHAYTRRALVSDYGFSRKVRELFTHVQIKAPTASGSIDHYGLRDEHEFISEAFSNREFQDFLATVTWDGEKTAWQRFVAILGQLFGFKHESALSEVLRLGLDIAGGRDAYGGTVPGPRFALPTDEQGRKRFDIPDESFYEKLVTGGANVEERVEKIERMLGRKPHEGVTYKIDTSRGLAKQDVEHVQRDFLMPIAKEVSKGEIPLGQSTLGDNGKPSLGDFMRYLAAQPRNIKLAGNEFTDAATGKVTKFGIEASPASGADSLGQPITNSYAAARLERAFSSDAAPQYRKIAELVREGNAWKLDRLVESGVQSKEWRDNVIAAYGEYWSSFADEDNGSTSPLSTSFQVQGSQYQQAKGRTNMGGDPFQLWLRDLASVISRTRNNAVGIEVGKLLEQYPELGRILPTGETRRGLMKRLAEINTELDLMVPTDPAGDRLRIERGEITRQLEKPTLEERETSRVYKWREGGQDVHAVLADPLMAKALHGVDIAQLPVFFRWVGPYSRLFRKMAAGYNPEFALGNAPRDVGYAWSKLYLQHGAKVANGAVSRVPTAAKALYEVERGLPATPATQSYHHYIAEAKANGADVGMVSFSDVENEMNVLREDAVGTERLENFVAVKSPEAFKRLGRIVLSFNGLVEAMTRTAVYVEMRESGHSVEESVSAYRRTTIDWAKRGIYSNTWLSFFKAFMPAGLKGTHNFVSTIRSSPAHRVAKLAAGLFAAGYAASLMSRAMSDEWEDESEWSKARRMTVKVGKYTVGLALPWGFNLFYYGGVLAADVMHGDKTAAEATADMAGAVIDTFDPLGTPPTTSETRRGADEMLKSAVIAASPQVVQPLAEIAVNKTFTGGPVYPDSPYMADHERKWRDTADWAVNFAEFLNRAGGGTKSTEGSGISSVSPAAMEHVIKGYAPGIGQLIEDAAFTGGKILTGEMSDLTWNRIPFMRKFIRETPSSASAQKYAVASRLIEDAVGRIKDFEPRGGDYGVAAYADAKRAIDEYLAQKRKELDMATDSKHRKAIEDEMKWMREQLTRRVKQATKPK